MTEKSIWKHKEYTKFYSSFFIGNIGDWFDFFALQVIFAHQFQVTANGIVYLLAAYMMPMIILASYAGSLADKVNKKRLMLWTDLIAGLFTVALIYASSMQIALALVCIRSVFVAFNAPAQRPASQLLLPENLQLKAASYERVAFQSCRIIGPMLGAVVVAVYSAQVCLMVNAGSFFISAFILLFLRSKPWAGVAPKESDTTEGSQSNFKLTFQFVRNNPLLRTLVPILLTSSLFIMMVELQLVILLRDIIPSRPDILGYVIGFSAIGSVLSAVWLGRNKQLCQFGWRLVLCFTLVAIGYNFMGIYQVSWPIELFLLASLLSGFGLGISFVLQSYALKKEVPAEQMGRISGVLSTAQGIAYAVGVGLSGNLIAWVGPRRSFIAIGCICLAFGVLAFLLRRSMVADSVGSQPSS